MLQVAGEFVRASDVTNAITTMRDNRGDSAVDLNEVIDMLSSLLRGGGTSEVRPTEQLAHAVQCSRPSRMVDLAKITLVVAIVLHSRSG